MSVREKDYAIEEIKGELKVLFPIIVFIKRI